MKTPIQVNRRNEEYMLREYISQAKKAP